MPTEIKIKGNKNEKKSNFCVKSRHKEQLNDLKSLLGSILKMKDTRPDKEMFSVVIKKFIYTITTVPDDYFLSDACESTHEMFLEFRIILGYFEKGVTGKKMTVALEDIETVSKDLYKTYKEFLSDPSYNGTNFPKPKKIKAMRQLAELVKDAEGVVILNKSKVPKVKVAKKEDHVAIDIPNEVEFEPASEALKEMINSFSLNYSRSDNLNDTTNQPRASSPADSVSTSSSSFNPDTSILKSYETPLTPRLYSEEVSTIKATTLKMGNAKDSVLVAAMGELMAPPPPPPSTRHGRIAYVQEGRNDKLAPPIPSRRSLSLKPPILVDDDGDILPSNGPSSLIPPKSAVSSIYESSGGRIFVDEDYHLSDTMQLDTPKGFTPRGGSSKILEDDDSFIVAYRESVMKSSVVRNVPEENKKTMAVEMESSGWSLKNRF